MVATDDKTGRGQDKQKVSCNNICRTSEISTQMLDRGAFIRTSNGAPSLMMRGQWSND